MSRTRALFVKARHVMEDEIFRPVYRHARFRLAVRYRAMLRNVIFIGVTGSCGKTTAKELIAAVLSSQFMGHKSLGNTNTLHRAAKTILYVRPWHKFCVQEISVTTIEKSIELLRPHIGVVTNIGTDHISAFRTVEGIAAEKGKLIEALPLQHGVAILNADDPNVLAMRARCAGRVITYGVESDATLRAENVRCSWPERLSFTLLYDGQSYVVQTQLCGAHWVSSVLAALAVGLAMDLPLATAVQAIQTVPPVEGRMSPVIRSDGVTIIRDDAKAPLWSISSALEFLKEAQAKRRIIVIGTISDYAGNSDRQYVSVASQALTAADHTIFVGSRASKCLKAKRHPQDTALQAFYSVEAACDYLRGLLRPGDLVLLKGSGRDRLEEIISAGMAVKQGLQHTATADSTVRPFRQSHANRRIGLLPHGLASASEHPVQIVVGLGNVGSEYRDTPHNVGQRVLDFLASSLGGKWTQIDQAMVAGVEWQGESVYLVQTMTPVNSSGPVLSHLSHRLGFGPAECILVHDDVDLPLGTVRMRIRGGDGGHRGIGSILQAFQTDAIRRVKIGVGRPERQDEVKRHVLAAFSPAELAQVERACTEAADRALELVASSKRGSSIVEHQAYSTREQPARDSLRS